MTLLTPAETADFLKVSVRTLRRLTVPKVRIGGQVRYDLADLEAYVLRQKQGQLVDITTTKTLVHSPAPLLLTVRLDDMMRGASVRPIRHRSPVLARKKTP